MKTKTTKRTIAAASADTILAEGILGKMAVGDEMPYDTLAAAGLPDPMGAGRHALYSARHRLLRDRQMVFACVPGEAIRRLGDVEMIGHGDNMVDKLRRASRRGLRVVLAVADWPALSPEQKIKHNTTALVLGSVSVLTGKPGQRKIAARVSEAHVLTEQEVRAIAETI